MANMTLSIPDDLLVRMKKFNEIKWSEIARRAMEQRVRDLELMNSITSKSKLTEKDVIEIGKKIKKATSMKFNENSNRY